VISLEKTTGHSYASQLNTVEAKNHAGHQDPAHNYWAPQEQMPMAAMLDFRHISLYLGIFLTPLFVSAQVGQADVPTSAPAASNLKAADPFDPGTGIYSREYADLFVKDTIPIDFVRTQRNMDPRSRAFGVGGSTSYDLFIVGDSEHFSWVSLILADGSQARYVRVSPGTGFSDAIFENRETPGKFFLSRISWNHHGSWTVVLRDGTEITVHGCNAKSKPGQCAVTEIKNTKQERLTVDRDLDGNILKINSPHGHSIALTNDSAGRITRAEDDSHRWRTYRYDQKGCLVEARSWRGDHQTFDYDAGFNMTFVHEKGPKNDGLPPYDFAANTRFDEQNRFKSQKVTTGETYSVKYLSDGQDKIRQADVQENSGLVRYFYNAANYETRQEFHPIKGSGWTLERVHDPDSNAVVRVTLKCESAQFRVPIKIDKQLQETGEARIKFLTQSCDLADQKMLPSQNSTASEQQ
jgi:hypothetical protein